VFTFAKGGFIMNFLTKLFIACVVTVGVIGPAVAQGETPLEAPFAGTAANAFPSQDAGISAYVKAGQQFNLNDVRSAFTEFDAVGDNFIIGVIELDNFGGKSKVRVYVDADGWIIAFLKRNESTAGIMQWHPADVRSPRIATIPRNTLLDALKVVIDALGAGALPQVKYFHFRHPAATHMVLFVKTCGENGSKITQVQIPTEFTLYEASFYHYAFDALSAQLSVDGTVVSMLKTNDNSDWGRKIDSYKGAVSAGMLSKIEVQYRHAYYGSSDDGPAEEDQGSAGVATAIVYGQPAQ
jgi:hypothetical protein